MNRKGNWQISLALGSFGALGIGFMVFMNAGEYGNAFWTAGFAFGLAYIIFR